MDTLAHDGMATLQASLEETRRRFLGQVAELRPRLHRFCARMTGSALDGEDVVQETLAQGFFNLATLRDETRLEPWLFRIAHHRCVDFLRRERRTREETVPWSDAHETAGASEPLLDDGEPVDDALAALVGRLPPKERASVLLKDVLDYRLNEVAEVVDSTVGGVKAALHRGRARLHTFREAAGEGEPAAREMDPGQRRLLALYAECFNRRDWDALRNLIRVDARLEVVGVGDDRILAGRYFGNYAALPFEWRMSPAMVDGEPVILLRKRSGADWHPHTALRIRWDAGHVAHIRDYVHVDYLLQDAHVETTEA